MRTVPGERPTDGTEDDAGNGTHGKPADGVRTCGEGMDCEKDPAAGIRNAEDDEKEGGVRVDTTVDRMIEAAVAEEWEQQNRTGREICPEWDNAIKQIEKARELMQDAEELLKEAAEMVNASCETDRIASLADEIRFLGADMDKQTERMKKA